MSQKKKLIEVALPLEAINEASVRENYIYRGNPSSLHKWWAQRPLAAARAVIFAQMVDDPSAHPDLFRTDKAQDKERQRLFRIIEDLVLWENTTNEKVLQAAREEIWQSWRRACAENADDPRANELFDRRRLPAFHDPFAGGGTLPLEAQRLGLESYASDLNPVAVMINKAMIEIPPKFAGKPPINPESRKDNEMFRREWKGTQGLAEDVRYYGQRMRDEAEKQIGHLYPKIEVTAEMVKARPDLAPYMGKMLTVIAWLWARTVKSPNPAFAQVDVPLASTFMLSTKVGKEAYVEPVIENGKYRFEVKVGKPKHAERAKKGTKLSRGANFECLMSGAPIVGDYIKAEGRAGRLSSRLMAIVAEGERGRIYLSPTPEMEAIMLTELSTWKPETPLPADMRSHWTPPYGLTTYGDLFTPRQLVALTTFSDLVQKTSEWIKHDARAQGLDDDGKPLRDGGIGATAYSEAVAVYLAFVHDKYLMYGNSLVPWYSKESRPSMLFSRQAIPMVWDYTELNPFSLIGGSLTQSITIVASAMEGLPTSSSPATVFQRDAASHGCEPDTVVSTDPPYYDNIGYADLSDFFYIWLRRALKATFTDVFSTLAVPKAEELVASPYRYGSKEKAEAFFLGGMTLAMRRLAEKAHPAFPVTIYYAFKQSESDNEAGTVSTGWDTFLDALIQAGFAISGTWPMRTERQGRMVGNDTNALASSIILVCRKRGTAYTTTRREFFAAMKSELPIAIEQLQRGNIAPVDLAQAAIGPGMAVYTRYENVIDPEGNSLSVRDALALINQILDETLAEQEGDFDSDSRWALAWFDQSGFAPGEYGVAETLSKAKNTSVSGLVDAGILASKGGKVRLLKPEELPADWDPLKDKRLTTWEIVHHLIRSLESSGESAAASLVANLGSKAETARELCYRLYTLCERKKRAAEALSYNALVQSWPEITRLAREGSKPQVAQTEIFDIDEKE